MNSYLLMGASPDGGNGQLVFFLLIMVVFYFFLIRPQQKRAKEAKKFKEGLTKGAHVVTVGGIHGKIIEVKESTVTLDCDGKAKLVVEKSAISAEYSNGTGSSELAEGIKK